MDEIFDPLEGLGSIGTEDEPEGDALAQLDDAFDPSEMSETKEVLYNDVRLPEQRGAVEAFLLPTRGYTVLNDRAEQVSVFSALRKAAGKERERIIDLIVRRSLRLVVAIARRYMSCGVPLEHLLQEGSVGLFKAIEKFEPERGNMFATYAFWWISQSIRRYIEESGEGRTMHLPVYITEGIKSVGRVIAHHRLLTGEFPTPYQVYLNMNENRSVAPTEEATAPDAVINHDEKASEADDAEKREEKPAKSGCVSLFHVARCMRLMRDKRLSLDAASRRVDDKTEFEKLGDLVADRSAGPQASVEARSLLEDCLVVMTKIRQAIYRMDPRTSFIMAMRLGLDGESITLEEIGAKFQLTRERVRQIEVRGNKRLTELFGLDTGEIRRIREIAEEVGAVADSA